MLSGGGVLRGIAVARAAGVAYIKNERPASGCARQLMANGEDDRCAGVDRHGVAGTRVNGARRKQQTLSGSIAYCARQPH